MRKPIEQVLSGEQIVTPNSRDRVHGVGDPTDGMVPVNSDNNSQGQYPAGTMVDVVR
jgi:hypothetical protein